jgi:hypothetical protein
MNIASTNCKRTMLANLLPCRLSNLRATTIALAFGGSFLLLSQSLPAEENPATATVMPERAGWVEQAKIFPGSIHLEAKLDTGAEGASLHADNVELFSRNGEEWVKFDVTDQQGKLSAFERKVHRTAKIKRHEQEPSERPVIMLSICLGDVFEETEVNLADRSNYEYPLLVGRHFLADHFLVDASATHLLTPNCPVDSSK